VLLIAPKKYTGAAKVNTCPPDVYFITRPTLRATLNLLDAQ
jgi:hypothetical protein